MKLWNSSTILTKTIKNFEGDIFHMRMHNSAVIINSLLTSPMVSRASLDRTGIREGSGSEIVLMVSNVFLAFFLSFPPRLSSFINAISVLEMTIIAFVSKIRTDSRKDQQHKALQTKGHCWGNSALCCLSVNP